MISASPKVDGVSAPGRGESLGPKDIIDLTGDSPITAPRVLPPKHSVFIDLTGDSPMPAGGDLLSPPARNGASPEVINLVCKIPADPGLNALLRLVGLVHLMW